MASSLAWVRKRSSSLKSDSFSPGNPTMKLDRRRLRGLGADGVEQFQEPVGVAEAAHGTQHVGGRVLEGQVEVRDDLGGRGQHVDQPGPHLGGLEVADADALDAVHLGQLRQQGLQQADVAQVLAVRGVVLGDQHDLLDALLREPAGLAQHVAGTARDEGARKDGMAQKEQRRSQPEASLTEATGLLSRRRRSGARGPEAGASPSGRSAGASATGSCAWPGRATSASWRAAGLIGSSLRRSRGCGRRGCRR